MYGSFLSLSLSPGWKKKETLAGLILSPAKNNIFTFLAFSLNGIPGEAEVAGVERGGKWRTVRAFIVPEGEMQGRHVNLIKNGGGGNAEVAVDLANGRAN